MRLTRNKSPLGLLEAVPEVLARVPDPSRVRFTIVGDGPERPRLERRAARFGVTDRVVFTGFLNPAEVQHHLHRAQIYVLSGRREALPISLLEARAAGLPIVAMAGGGVSEVIEAGPHGSSRRRIANSSMRSSG